MNVGIHVNQNCFGKIELVKDFIITLFSLN